MGPWFFVRGLLGLNGLFVFLAAPAAWFSFLRGVRGVNLFLYICHLTICHQYFLSSLIRSFLPTGQADLTDWADFFFSLAKRHPCNLHNLGMGLLAALEGFFCPRIIGIKWIFDLCSVRSYPCNLRNLRMILFAALRRGHFQLSIPWAKAYKAFQNFPSPCKHKKMKK